MKPIPVQIWNIFLNGGWFTVKLLGSFSRIQNKVYENKTEVKPVPEKNLPAPQGCELPVHSKTGQLGLEEVYR
jgi:hypothetical protein